MISKPKGLLYVVLLTGAIAGALVAAERYVVGHSAAAVTSASSPQPTAPPKPRVDGWQNFKFGMTLEQIESQKLCETIKKVQTEPEPPEEGEYTCNGVPNPNRQALLAAGAKPDFVDYVFLSFVRGKLAHVKIITGFHLSDYGASNTKLFEKYGQWYGDDVNPDEARSADVQTRKTAAFMGGESNRLSRIFADGAVMLTGIRPSPREPNFILTAVSYYDSSAYRSTINAKDL